MPRPVERRVFRPRRRTSWATRLLIVILLLLLGGSVGAYFVVGLPGQLARLAQLEADEMVAARTNAAGLGPQLATIWTEIGQQGSFMLARDRVDLQAAAAQKLEKATDDALAHVHAAVTLIAQADGVPLQLHRPDFTADRAALAHLEKGLLEARRLAHAATLQLNIAQHVLDDRNTFDNQLSAGLRARNWAQASRASTDLQADLPIRVDAIANPEALIDPLWGKWVEAMLAYAYTAQSYSLAQASGRNPNELTARLQAQAGDYENTLRAARDGTKAWSQQAVQPGLDTVTRELGSGS